MAENKEKRSVYVQNGMSTAPLREALRVPAVNPPPPAASPPPQPVAEKKD